MHFNVSKNNKNKHTYTTRNTIITLVWCIIHYPVNVIDDFTVVYIPYHVLSVFVLGPVSFLCLQHNGVNYNYGEDGVYYWYFAEIT